MESSFKVAPETWFVSYRGDTSIDPPSEIIEFKSGLLIVSPPWSVAHRPLLWFCVPQTEVKDFPQMLNLFPLTSTFIQR
ncbi:MAG: hypothetical protein H7329_17835 [Opitutaceae bacterium]|nr:hypothetical protein [Cytophagales bacterium]